jgi:RNA polymerase sigma-70 factor (ECF subfamily)
MDEAEVLQGLKERDIKAIKVLYDSLFTDLRFLAERITKDELEAEDIAHTSLTKLWESGMSQFDTLEHVKNYALKMTQHAALDYLKKQKSKKRYQQHLQYTLDKSEEFIADRSRYEMEVIRIIYAEVEKLPNQTKEVFKLVYLQKVPRSEVAHNLSISINTVHVHCSRAIKELRQVISERELLLLLLLLNLGKN